MKAIIDFIQTLGVAEIVITVLLIAICVIAWFDCKSIDNMYDVDNERFKKHKQ